MLKWESHYNTYLFATILAILFCSCAIVKPYQRMYLNDEAMQLQKNAAEKFSSAIHHYREGAAGGGKGAGSGGCGCN